MSSAAIPGGRILAGATVTAALFAALIMLMIMAMTNAFIGSRPQQGAFRPSKEAVADIPANILPLYLQVGEETGVDWAILAAIGKIETDHGRSNAPGVHSGLNAYGCCAGPMQFDITGAGHGTWGVYGVDGDHDGKIDVYDPADAIPAAAAYLKASGAPDYNRAIFAYNHAGWYVAQVLEQATVYRGVLAAADGPATTGLAAATRTAADVLYLADGPRPQIKLTALQRNDLSTGQIDPRVSSLLVAIAARHTITVTSLKSDHGEFTTSGSISNHSAGRAADIGVVDGEACNSLLHGQNGKCWHLARELARTKGPLHPTELIYGVDPDGPAGPAFACLTAACGGDHAYHIHAGWSQ